MSLHTIAVALLLGVAGTASAQTAVYRCGNEYTRMPCKQGTVVDTQNSARTAEQRAEATRVAAAERQLADDMARDRRRAETAVRPASAGSLGPAKPVAVQAKGPTAGKAKKKKKSGADRDDFVASVPKPKG